MEYPPGNVYVFAVAVRLWQGFSLGLMVETGTIVHKNVLKLTAINQDNMQPELYAVFDVALRCQ